MSANKPSRRLSHTVWICLAVITLTFLSASVLSLVKINHLRQEDLLLTEVQMPSALASLRLMNGVEQSITSLYNQLLFPKKTHNEVDNPIWETSIAPAFSRLSEVAQHSNRVQQDLVKLHHALLAFHQLQKTINAFIASGQWVEAKEAVESRLMPQIVPIRRYTYALHEGIQQDILEHLQYIKEETSELYITSILFLGLGLITSIIFGILIIRSLTRPIKRTVEITNDLAKGKLDMPVDLSGAYEFEALNESLKRTIATLKNLSHIAERVANGEYTKKVEVKSAEDRLAKTINIMIDNFNTIVKQADTIAAGDYTMTVAARSKHDALAVAINNMTKSLAQNAQSNKEQSWLKDGLTELANSISGQRHLHTLSDAAIGSICHYVGSPYGIIYINQETPSGITRGGTFSLSQSNKKAPLLFQDKKNIIEQVVREKSVFVMEDSINGDGLCLSESLSSNRLSRYVYPLVFGEKVVGAIDLVSFKTLSPLQRLYLDKITYILSSQIYSAQQHQIITEKNKALKKAKKALTLQKSQLEKSDQYKTEFLTNVSHELKTPLNSLLSFSRQLKENREKNLSDEQIKALAIMEKSGHSLLRLIDDLLDLGKVNAGKLRLHPETVTLKKITTRVLEAFKNSASEKGLQLMSEFKGPLPKTIFTDGNRLQQILRNFISNAIKFTREGSVTLTIAPVPSKNALRFCVSDTGIGIPPAKQSMIFKAFQQADGTTTRHYGGTGLGLSISTQLAALLQGQIHLESTPGKGSRFTLIIPYSLTGKNLLTAPVIASETDREEKHHWDAVTYTDFFHLEFTNKTLLLIEKNMRTAFKIKAHLQKSNNTVIIAYSLKNAQRHLAENKTLHVLLLGTLPQEENNAHNVELIKAIAAMNHCEFRCIHNHPLQHLRLVP